VADAATGGRPPNVTVSRALSAMSVVRRAVLARVANESSIGSWSDVRDRTPGGYEARCCLATSDDGDLRTGELEDG